MTSYRRGRGVVLEVRDVSEADRLFVLYTRELGRVDVEATGIRKATSKLSGNIERHAVVDVVFIDTRKGHRLIDTVMIARPTSDIALYKRNAYFARFLNLVIHGSEVDTELWEVVSSVFSGENKTTELLELEAVVLSILGMLPESGVKNQQDVKKILIANHML